MGDIRTDFFDVIAPSARAYEFVEESTGSRDLALIAAILSIPASFAYSLYVIPREILRSQSRREDA